MAQLAAINKAGGIKTEIVFDGAKELTKKLRFADPTYAEPLRQALLLAAEEVREQAVKVAPIRTGKLRASLTAAVSKAPVPKWGRVKTTIKNKGFRYPFALETGKMYHYRNTQRETRGWLVRAFYAKAAQVQAILTTTAAAIEQRFGSN